MTQELPAISIVVIGRNEGERLVRCLKSVQAADYPRDKLELIYVDTDSMDDSCNVAKQSSARVIAIRPERPCAAIARNAGLRVATHRLIQFLDGDTVLNHSWLRTAVEGFDDPAVACTFGRVEESRPRASVYMRVAAFDWHIQSGQADYCGGNAMFRRNVLQKVGGFDESLIAGEEPELCCRIRRSGSVLRCYDELMVQHDLGITSFRQYWRRAVRSGWGYLVVAVACRAGPGHLWLRKNVSNVTEVAIWLLVLGLGTVLWGWWGLISLGILLNVRTLWIAGRVRPRTDNWKSALLYGMHCQFLRIPVFVGQLRGLSYLVWRRPTRLTDYKK